MELNHKYLLYNFGHKTSNIVVLLSLYGKKMAQTDETKITTYKITPEKAWEAAIGQLKITMDKQTFSTLMGKSEFVKYENNTFFISVPNTFTRDWLEQRLTETVIRILSGIMEGQQFVQFVLESNVNAIREEKTVLSQPAVATVSASQSVCREGAINPRYTFDNFIVGPSNNLAYAASRAVAAMPATAYNPLFIYSGVGLGKTHLLHAIGNEIIRNQNKAVLYVSSEEFTNDFINSIQRHENTAFREKYRNIDVLLIDDIQFIIGKESTQEAFFHTFNTLYQQDKQIIITSDRSPKSMSTLDERMRSRFEWGLTVDMQTPDLETRIAILSVRAEKVGKSVPRDILEMIARQFPNNVRELEGALNRVLAVSDLCGKTLDKDLVLMSLGELLPQQNATPLEQILNVVSKVFGVPTEKILSRDRSKNVALSRQVVMFLLRNEENLSLPQIGKELGGRDHSTVIHGCDRVASLLSSDIRFRNLFEKVHEQLYGEPCFVMA